MEGAEMVTPVTHENDETRHRSYGQDGPSSRSPARSQRQICPRKNERENEQH